MDLADLDDLLQVQTGVVSRRQLNAAGARGYDVERWLRRRELARLHPRVFVDHTGQPTWLQRAWAAVLWAEPAALSHDSAVRIGDRSRHDTAADDGPIHVAIAGARRLAPIEGVVVHRERHLADRLVDLQPPRIRLEQALLDLAAEAATDHDAVAVLADACSARRTTAERLLEHAAHRPRLPRRQRLVTVLQDIATGTCSALEQAYLESVVRPHGLPPGTRQAAHRHRGDQRYRDVLVEAQSLCVELDGRVVHGSAAARDRDLDRDLDSVVDDDVLTVRLSWGQVVERGCRTAHRLGRLLQARGWTGTTTPCGAACAAA